MAQVLRYPYDAITETTDYLQIDISSYKAVGADLVSSSTARKFKASDSSNPSSLSPSALVDKGTILLPIPSNIQDGNSVKYADDTLNGYVAGAFNATSKVMEGINLEDLSGSASKVTNEVYKYIKGDKGLNETTKRLMIKSLAANAVSIFGGNVTIDQILARETGEIFNPNMELLFNGVTLRSFKFSFKMTPRSKDEAKQVKLIIRTLKQNMAPRTTGATNANFLRTPNVFNLTYRKGNTDHPFLHKFKQSALTDINVNYTGENIYATYEDGSPISVIMDLTFRELVPIYDSDYSSSDDSVGY